MCAARQRLGDGMVAHWIGRSVEQERFCRQPPRDGRSGGLCEGSARLAGRRVKTVRQLQGRKSGGRGRTEEVRAQPTACRARRARRLFIPCLRSRINHSLVTSLGLGARKVFC